MTHPTNPNAVKVKRDGERGWHWVAAFDPEKHELFDEQPPADDKPKAARKATRKPRATK